MIERFFDEMRRAVAAANKATDPPQADEKLHSPPAGDESFLAVIPTVRKIVRRKLFSAARRGDESDLVQKIVVQLLIWRKNQPDKSEEMTAQEWQSFASKTTYRAANRHLSSNKHLTEPLEDVAEEISGENRIAGNTETEVASLLRVFWQGICQLSLRQRRALLLNSEPLVVALRRNGIGNEKLSEVLELDESELAEIINRLPLSDAQIARLAAARDNTKNQNINSLTKSVKKARHEARARLQKIISE